ncbi:MAG: hypothetical protein H6717_27570 [Polyangiaceae bacterium]|nr:hypothetical protein [Polyangiaceae bacterium]
MDELGHAIAAFEQRDVPVRQAIAHLIDPLDRARLISLRFEGGERAADEARSLLEGVGFRSAVLQESFVASVLEAAGAHERALAARLAALAECPKYDSWLSALVLSRTARTLLELGRGAEALPFAERALRFQPLDPRALVILSRVRAAVGDAAGAASVRAWLFDHGAGPALLPDAPTNADRTATAYVPTLHDLEPISDADVARYLVLFRRDAGLTRTLTSGRRHLATQLRFGDVCGARATSTYYAGGTPRPSDALLWLGLDEGTCTDYLATDGLVEEVAKLPLPKGSAKLVHKHPGKRQEALEELAKKGKAPRALLLDLIWSVAHEAGQALPDDPILLAAAEEERALGEIGFPIFAGTPGDDELRHGSIGESEGYLDDAGGLISYPTRQEPETDPYVPFLERAANGRSKCKVCKQAIAQGTVRLVTRAKAFPVETKYVHAECGSHKRWAKMLAAAQARSRF